MTSDPSRVRAVVSVLRRVILPSSDLCLHLPSQSAVLGETGELVWGLGQGTTSWPAIIRKGRGDHLLARSVTVEWYAEKTTTLVS